MRPGDVVAWLCGNTHELLEAYYGVLLAGAVLLPLNIRLSAAELRSMLDRLAAPSVLFRHPDQPDPGGPVRQVVLGDELRGARWPASRPTRSTPPAVDERAPAEIFFTSGSTGMPKGAVLTHRNLYLHAVHNALTNAITGDDVILHIVPLFHVNGWGTPHYLTGLGGVHVMLPRFDAGEVLRLIEAHGVTRLFAVPAMVPDAARPPRPRRPATCSSVVQASIGGSPVRPQLLAEVEAAFGCTAICGYGMTEASPDPDPLARQARRAAVRASGGPPPACRSSASTSACSAPTTSRCRGTARPSARSAPARTT